MTGMPNALLKRPKRPSQRRSTPVERNDAESYFGRNLAARSLHHPFGSCERFGTCQFYLWPCGMLSCCVYSSPVDPLRIGPKSFQIIKITSFRKKGMQHNVTPVLQDPRTLFVTFRCGRLVTARFHLDPHFITECMHLTSTGSRGNHEKIHNRSNPRQIEYDGLLTTIFFAQFGNVAGVFQAALQSIL